MCFLQVNLEFLVADKRTFLTDKEHALQTLFGEANEVQENFNTEIISISDRVATAFASLKVICYTKTYLLKLSIAKGIEVHKLLLEYYY